MEIVTKEGSGYGATRRMHFYLKCGCEVTLRRGSPQGEIDFLCPNGCDPKSAYQLARRKKRDDKERVSL